MKILCIFVMLFLFSGCWQNIDHDYEHEIRCQRYDMIPVCLTNCINEVKSHGFYITQISITRFAGCYKINVQGVNYQRTLEKKFGRGGSFYDNN